MRIVKFFIRRRITTLCLNGGILLLGLFCLNKTAVDLFPSIHLPTLTVTLPAPGLNAQDIESKITVPVEEYFNTLPHLKSMRSESQLNQAIFILKFEWDSSIDFAALSVREVLKNVKLPDEAEAPLIFRWNPAEEPILRAELATQTSLIDLTSTIEKKIIPHLERLPGVATVQKSGTRHLEIKIKIDPQELSARGLTVSHLVQTLESENITKQIGMFQDGHYELALSIDGEFKSVEELQEIPITLDPKKPIRLKDIAEITKEPQEIESMARLNGQPSIGLQIKKSHTAATLTVIDSIKSALKEKQAEFPGLTVTYSKDDSVYIRMSRNNLFSNLQQGIVLTFIFVFLFLRSLGATFIICLAIPISVVGTFSLMTYFGVTQNVFSLAGFTLAAGMIVDSAVVLLENIYRQFKEEGKSALRAAVEGTQEVGLGVISAVLTTMAIFVPIVLCVKGVIGILFDDIAFTFIISLGLSLIVAFTFIPSVSVWILKRGELFPKTPSKHFQKLSIWADALRTRFLLLLEFFLKRRAHSLLCIISVYGICLLSLALLPGKDLIPLGEVQSLWIKIKNSRGARLTNTDQFSKRVEEKMESYPKITTVAASVRDEESDIIVNLNEGVLSTRDIHRTLEGVRETLRTVPGITVEVLAKPRLDDTEGIGYPITLTVKEDSALKRQAMVNSLAERLETLPDLLYIQTSQKESHPEVHVVLDHRRLRDYHLTSQSIAHLIYSHMHGIEATQLRTASHETVPIRIVHEKEAQVEELQTLPLLLSGKKGFFTLPLSEVSEIQDLQGESTRERIDHTVSTTLYAHLKTNRRSLEAITDDIKTIIQETPQAPGAVGIESTLKVFQETFSDLSLALIIAIILVYMILAAHFESLTQPIALMLTIPLAGIGVLVGVTLWGFYLDVIVMLGIILLVGLAVDTGTLLIEYINILRHRGMDRHEAILTAVRHRLRPILIVVLTDMVGVLPMAFQTGAGAEMYQGFAVVTFFGVGSATFFTLLVLPQLYILFEDAADWLSLKWLHLEVTHKTERSSS